MRWRVLVELRQKWCEFFKAKKLWESEMWVELRLASCCKRPATDGEPPSDGAIWSRFSGEFRIRGERATMTWWNVVMIRHYASMHQRHQPYFTQNPSSRPLLGEFGDWRIEWWMQWIQWMLWWITVDEMPSVQAMRNRSLVYFRGFAWISAAFVAWTLWSQSYNVRDVQHGW